MRQLKQNHRQLGIGDGDSRSTTILIPYLTPRRSFSFVNHPTDITAQEQSAVGRVGQWTDNMALDSRLSLPNNPYSEVRMKRKIGITLFILGNSYLWGHVVVALVRGNL